MEYLEPADLRTLAPESPALATPWGGIMPSRSLSRLIVEQAREDVTACLREQRHLFQTGDPRIDRRSMLENLSSTLLGGDWCPPGMSREEIDAIPERIRQGLVIALLEGQPVGGYAEAIYQALLEHHGYPVDVPVARPRTREQVSVLRVD